MWFLLQSLIIFAVVASNIEWHWTPNGYLASLLGVGAIVAPPDAVAATTILRELRLPHRVSVILEGEALLNDASALLIYRLAVAAVLAGGNIGADAIAPAFLLSLFGSVIAGLGLAWVIGHITRRIEDAPSSIVVQFVSTYGVPLPSWRTGLIIGWAGTRGLVTVA